MSASNIAVPALLFPCALYVGMVVRQYIHQRAVQSSLLSSDNNKHGNGGRDHDNGKDNNKRDLVFVSSNEGAAPVRCGEEGAEPDGEAFSLLLHLCSNPHLWSQIWFLSQRMRL